MVELRRRGLTGDPRWLEVEVWCLEGEGGMRKKDEKTWVGVKVRDDRVFVFTFED